jgi:hypothetical protein
MNNTTTIIVSVVCAVFASTGFWAFLTYVLQGKDTKETAEGQMLKGLAHDRICHLGKAYLKNGYIPHDDYQNLYVYLYLPYRNLGGNGLVEKIMKEVERLPLTLAEQEGDNGNGT